MPERHRVQTSVLTPRPEEKQPIAPSVDLPEDGPSEDLSRATTVRRFARLPVNALVSPDASIPYELVYEHLPSGIVVVDLSGAVVHANRAARDLIGPALARPYARCCPIFGCGKAGTPLAHGCVTQLALARDTATPEVRVETQVDPEIKASVWLTGAAIGGGGVEAAAALQVRPAMSGDRRRRIAPDSAPEGALRIYTRGRTRLEVGDTPIAGEWLAHRPGALLKYLVTERSRPVPVEELLETFWADGARAGATNVRQAIHTLRDRLDPRREKRAQTQFVVARTGGGGYELDVERVWIDANEFERAARDGLDALHRRDLDEADLLLLEAGALYRGDFLSDEPYADWALNERERLRDMAAHVLRALATLRLERDDAEAAIEPLQRLAELEPFDDRCQRELLEQLLRLGRHADAQRRYQAVRRRFRRAFGADPEWTLNELVGA